MKLLPDEKYTKMEFNLIGEGKKRVGKMEKGCLSKNFPEEVIPGKRLGRRSSTEKPRRPETLMNLRGSPWT